MGLKEAVEDTESRIWTSKSPKGISGSQHTGFPLLEGPHCEVSCRTERTQGLEVGDPLERKVPAHLLERPRANRYLVSKVESLS